MVAHQGRPTKPKTGTGPRNQTWAGQDQIHEFPQESSAEFLTMLKNHEPKPPSKSFGPRVWNRHKKGIPAGAVYVGRPTKWGNYSGDVNKDGSNRAEVIARYRQDLLSNPKLMADLYELRGKDLVCWCAPKRCHADVLLELANKEQAP